MYVDTSTVTTKHGTYTRHLLRDSYREDGKVKHTTIANLGACSEEEIRAIKLALSNKHNLDSISNIGDTLKLKQGLSVGTLIVLNELAKRIGLSKALGNTQQGKLALWQIISRIITQGSRLSAVRLAESHAACDVLKLDKFTEDDLYDNLDWLSLNQEKIEMALYTNSKPDQKPVFYLYDVTSSYLEGVENEYSSFGYNRDGKKGKRQIVIGCICDEEGDPISVEVFDGNTSDCKTVDSQLEKIKKRFGNAEIVFVGDRGMIRNLSDTEVFKVDDVKYITAITKAQINTLLNNGLIQMDLFDNELVEVQDNDGIRYVLRKNPVRCSEIKKSREKKLESLRMKVEKQNKYLEEHPRAKTATIKNYLDKYIKKIKINNWVSINIVDRTVTIKEDVELLLEDSKLDGCYVLKTNVSEDKANKTTVHTRYKDLAHVELAFRTCKTSFLEIRPIYVRKKMRTDGHVLVVMLAYRLSRELKKMWKDIDITVREGVNKLSTLTAIEVKINNRILFSKIPEARDDVLDLIKAAGVIIPESINSKNISVHTRKKLTGRRKNQASKPS